MTSFGIAKFLFGTAVLNFLFPEIDLSILTKLHMMQVKYAEIYKVVNNGP